MSTVPQSAIDNWKRDVDDVRPRYPISYAEAMQLAVERPYAQAAHWLNVARELREAGGSTAQPFVSDSAPAYVHRLLDAYLDDKPIDFGGEPIPDDLRERLEREFVRNDDPATSSARIPMPVTTRDQEAHDDRTQRIDTHLRTPLAPPLSEDAATDVMGAIRNCYHCGQAIAYDGTIPCWRHITSQQRVCLTLGDDDTIVHAWPAAVP